MARDLPAASGLHFGVSAEVLQGQRTRRGHLGCYHRLPGSIGRQAIDPGPQRLNWENWMKVFISSVISGMEEYREAAAKAARILKHEVLRSEDFGASPATPQRVCLAGVRAAGS
jgi:hypothetical protein